MSRSSPTVKGNIVANMAGPRNWQRAAYLREYERHGIDPNNPNPDGSDYHIMNAIESDDLPMWVVYDHPKDFPDVFVARKWLVRAGETVATTEILTAKTIDILRDALPRGLVRLERSDHDDQAIREVWL